MTSGRLTETDSARSLRIPKRLHEGSTLPHDPVFLLYADIQPGWRAVERFYRRENWETWKVLLFPFYEIYLLGNGLVGGVNYLRGKPDFGGREARLVRDALIAEIDRSPIDFVINVGDLVDDGRRPEDWRRFVRMHRDEEPLLLLRPYLPTPGNHERAYHAGPGLANYRAVFDYPDFYVLRSPHLSIYVLNSLYLIDQYRKIPDAEQEEFFEKWFSAPENSKEPSWLERRLIEGGTRFNLVVMHHPPVSFGRHAGDWEDPANGRGLGDKRMRLLNMLRRHRVQAVFAGHEHIYEHLLIRSVENVPVPDLHVIVAGSGGAPVRRLSRPAEVERLRMSYRRRGLDVRVLRRESMYNYLRVRGRPEGVEIEVFRVTGRDVPSVERIDVIRLEDGCAPAVSPPPPRDD